MSTALEQADLLIVDCQTTGATPERGHLLELGWARVPPGSAIAAEAVEARLIALPEGQTIPSRVSRITGIKDEHLSQALTPESAWLELCAAARAPGTPSDPERQALTVIHYARFELRFLRWLHECFTPESAFPLHVVCTHEIARKLLPELPRRGLRALAGYFGASPEELRRSAAHVTATFVVWRHLCALLGEHGVHTSAELRGFLERPAAKRRARGHVYPMARERRLSLPDQPGVYHMLRQNGDLLYVGKAKSLAKRVNSYFQKQRRIPDRTLEMLTQARDIRVHVTESALEAALMECDQIKSLAPPYNVALRVHEDRPLYFFSPGLEEVATEPSPRRRLGPLPSPDPAHCLSTLRALVHASVSGMRAPDHVADQAAPRLFHDVDNTPDADTLGQGVIRFCDDYLLSAGPAHITRALWSLGHDMWRERLLAAARDARAAEAHETQADADELSEQPSDNSAPDTDADADTDTDTDAAGDQEPIWDAERVSRYFARMTRWAVHAVRRGAWLCRLSESTLVWRVPRNTRGDILRLACFERGALVHCDDLPPGSMPPVPPGFARPVGERLHSFDAATYDRLRVFSTELRRLVKESAVVTVRFGPRHIADRETLERMLSWV